MRFTLFHCPKGWSGKFNTQAMKHQSEIHIGKIIRAQLKADKRSVSWLAQEIGCTRGHLYKMFRKPSIDCKLLLDISIATSFNFFKYYTAAFCEGMKVRTGEL